MRRIRLLAIALVFLMVLLSQFTGTGQAVTIIPDPTATETPVFESSEPAPETTSTATATSIPEATSTSTETATAFPTFDPCLTPEESGEAGQECVTETSTATPVTEPTFDPCLTQDVPVDEVGSTGEVDCSTATATLVVDPPVSPTTEPTVRPPFPTEISDPATLLPDNGSSNPSVVAAVTWFQPAHPVRMSPVCQTRVPERRTRPVPGGYWSSPSCSP